ncbi:hypothetical protein [Mycobacteroides chelonae]|uniref:hypothetical protein n=1 Tax=Mycobacteroides chelonae TaxID=1774 RepID=UPI0008A9ED3B|nr:hypothetical protein [Mycobacteroides chelonae]OHU48772.1 hypothetical protein BKG81_15190 [Mycobacteroides chelonae]
MTGSLYQHTGQALGSLEDFGGIVQMVTSIQQDLGDCQKALSECYKGGAPDAMQGVFKVLNERMDDVVVDITELLKQGTDHVHGNHDLDQQLAADW